MATVQERIAVEGKIASLEQEIAEYRADLSSAITQEERREIRELIKASRDNLSDLYKEKARLEGSTSGKSFEISFDDMFYSHHILFLHCF